MNTVGIINDPEAKLHREDDMSQIEALCKERGFDVIIVGAGVDGRIIGRLESIGGMTVLQRLEGRHVKLREPKHAPEMRNGPRDRFGRLK